MTKKPENPPKELTGEKLDGVTGALPAVQKVREAAARINYNPGLLGGVRVASADVD